MSKQLLIAILIANRIYVNLAIITELQQILELVLIHVNLQ
jgi:hypothetical protein